MAQVRSALGLAAGRARIFRKYGVAERNIERVWCESRSGTRLGCRLGRRGQRCHIQNDRLDQ